MVLCLIALPIFAILGIFSVKYRKLANDSLHCIFHTITLRKCESGLDDRIKSNITGHMLKFSPSIAGFTYKHYQLFSWVIIILFLWSGYYSTIGGYNYWLYGNCNGPEETGFCLLDPTSGNSGISQVDGIKPNLLLSIPVVDKHNPIIGPKNAELTIIEFGCYVCPYTKHAEKNIQEVIDAYNGKVNLQFKHFIIPGHNMGKETALAANCAQDQGKYDEYHKLLVENEEELTNEKLIDFTKQIGLNETQFTECQASELQMAEIEKDNLEGINAGVQGTPTFFVNGKKIVGPKPLKTFKTIIDEELNK